jgi:branched-chain amino acid transport system substrate-binding protein
MGSKNKVFPTIAGALIVVGLLALSGCEAKQKPIKIGYSLSLTGKYAETAKYQQDAYAMWAEEVNKRGGLLGRPVELVHYDDKSEPATGAEIYERMIGKEKVDLVLGPYSSAVTEAVAQVTERHGYPMITPGAASSKIFSQGRRYVFGVLSPARDYMDGALILARNKGLKTVAVLYADSVFPISSAEGVRRKAPGLSLEVVLEEKYPREATDLSDQLKKVKELKPDVLLAAGYFPDSVLIAKQLKELDLNPKIVVFTVGAAQPEFGSHLKEVAEYVYGTSQWEPDSRLKFPGQAQWVLKYVERFGGEPDYHAAAGWVAGQVLEACVKKVGSLEREAIRECLVTLETTTIIGLYKVDEATGEQRGHEILLIQWQKDRKEIVYPEKYATASPHYPTPAWAER